MIKKGNIIIRGFNFIDDYGAYLVSFGDRNITREDKVKIMSRFKHDSDSYKFYTNRIEEMKRFIAWLYDTYSKEDYDYFVENDKSGFLKECIELYNPKTGNLKAPKNAFDYSVDYTG